MSKANIYKGLKTLFFLAGFPLLLIMMIITMAPMFGQEVMGDYAQNWILIFTAIWVALMLAYWALDKFVGKKSENHHKFVLVAVAALSIICVLLPSVIYDAVMKPKYDAALAKLGDDADVKNYNSIMGWHRDFTERYKGETYYLINLNYDFMKMYGLEHTYSEWYDNADKENGLGYKYGSFEKADKLVADKLEALDKFNKASAELAAVEAAIAEKKQAYDAAVAAFEAEDTAENQTAMEAALAAYNQLVADSEDDFVRLKGQRVDISNYKDQLVQILLTALKDPALLPDGLDLTIFGLDIPVGDLLDLIMGLAGNMLTPEMIDGIIPDVIYTGIGKETIATYQKMVEGSDTDLSLAQAQAFDFKVDYYPGVLAAGAMKYASFICVGLVVFSIFMTDYFNKKQKEEENKND